MSKRLYQVPEAARQLSLGLTTTKALVASGELRSVKIGHARRVPADAIDEYVRRLDAAQNGDRAAVAPAALSVESPIAAQS
ncbi:helix-turn-helix domain-containing protein [Streptomyces sp. 130]|uniref:excisionase family DNA-binding protein n=1 Tax=Streptomyces sp. 130 TaxID=2591006 RepID=UPI0011801D2D|nr:excisionase family DNA-binding protein [Streptomyces sp. 130]TRV75149.1 helix-turn-helix domain-containing protein [Streptomyces sp. 130]